MYSNYKTSYKPAEYNINKFNYDSNNQYKYFPPKMEDSRSLVSSYQSISVIDYIYKNHKSNWEYREYLKNNAVDIQKEMQEKSLNDIGYYQRFIKNLSDYPETTSPIIPYFFSSMFDNSRPFGYQDSDMKQVYYTKEQLNARLMMPKIQKNI